jgi:hypothetical protein
MPTVLVRVAIAAGLITLPSLSAIGCAAFAAAIAPPRWAADVNLDFYVVAATVIPVLLLALMVELATVFAVEPVLQRVRKAADDAIAEGRAGPVDDVQHPSEARTHRLRRIEENTLREFAVMVGRVRWMVRGFFVAASTGEAVSLYAIAAGTSTPFTLVLSGGQTLVLIVFLAVAFEMRFLLD